MIDMMRQKYINAIFLAHCIAFNLGPHFLGPNQAFNYQDLPTTRDVERFKLRQDGKTGRGLRREQKNNQQDLYGILTSTHPSLGFRLTEYARTNGWAGAEMIGLVFRLSHMEAYEAVRTVGVETAKGAGGKQRMPGMPLFAVFTHAVNHDGTPGWHSHVVSNGMATDPSGKPRVIRNKEVLYAQDRAYQLAFQAALAHNAKKYLGLRNVTVAENGMAVDKTVDPLMPRQIGIGARKEKILAWMAQRNWDPAKQGSVRANIFSRDKVTKQFTLEDRLAAWGPLVDKAIAGYEQRTGRKWERAPKLEQVREPDPRAARPEPTVKEPTQEAKAKIDLDSYVQPKRVEPKVEATQEAKQETKAEQKRETKQETKAEQTQEARPEQKQESKAEQKAEQQQQQAKPGPQPQPEQKADQKQESKADAKQGVKPDPTRGPAGPGQWVLYDPALKPSVVAKLRDLVKKRLDVYVMIRDHEKIVARDRHRIDDVKGLEKFLEETHKRPRWYARQQANRAFRRNFMRKTPHELSDLMKRTFQEARKPSRVLKSYDRIQLSASLADKMTTDQFDRICRLANRAGAKVVLKGMTKQGPHPWERLVAHRLGRVQQQQRQRHERGQTYTY